MTEGPKPPPLTRRRPARPAGTGRLRITRDHDYGLQRGRQRLLAPSYPQPDPKLVERRGKVGSEGSPTSLDRIIRTAVPHPLLKLNKLFVRLLKRRPALRHPLATEMSNERCIPPAGRLGDL